MRRPTREVLEEIERRIVEAARSGDGVAKSDVWRFIVLRDGPKAAAWLVRQHAAQLKRDGMVDFVLRRKDTMPSWCRAALDCLATRKGWEIHELPRIDGARIHRVVWARGAACRRRERNRRPAVFN